MKKENEIGVIFAQGEQPCFAGFLYTGFFMLSMSMDMR